MKKCFILLFAASTLCATAQTDSTSALILFSGDTFRGHFFSYDITRQHPIFGLDAMDLATSEVSFLSLPMGYFANLNAIHGDRSERYAIRLATGRIDLYGEVDLGLYFGQNGSFSAADDPLLDVGYSFQYYSAQGGPVRTSSYAHLRAETMDCPASLPYLKKWNSYRWMQRFLLAAGAGTIAADVGLDPTSSLRLSPLTALGMLVAGSSYLLEGPKQNAQWNVVEAYNESAPTEFVTLTPLLE